MSPGDTTEPGDESTVASAYPVAVEQLAPAHPILPLASTKTSPFETPVEARIVPWIATPLVPLFARAHVREGAPPVPCPPAPPVEAVPPPTAEPPCALVPPAPVGEVASCPQAEVKKQ